MSERSATRGTRTTPSAIALFGAFYFAFALAALANNISMMNAFLGDLSSGLGSTAPNWLGYLGFGARLGVRLLLAWFILFRASNVARWLIVAIALPWAWQALDGLPALLRGDMSWLPWFGVLTLQLVALGFLFTPQARNWIVSKGRTIADDVEDFR